MFCMLLRKHMAGGRVLSVRQHALERVICIDVESRNELGDLAVKRLIIEIMGKHSNIILIDAEDDTILDSIKRIPFSVSRLRQILPGLKYELLVTDKKICVFQKRLIFKPHPQHHEGNQDFLNGSI